LTRKLLDPVTHLPKNAPGGKFSRELREGILDGASEALGEAMGEFVNTGLWDGKWNFRTGSMLGSATSGMVTSLAGSALTELGLSLAQWKYPQLDTLTNATTWPTPTTNTHTTSSGSGTGTGTGSTHPDTPTPLHTVTPLPTTLLTPTPQPPTTHTPLTTSPTLHDPDAINTIGTIDPSTIHTGTTTHTDPTKTTTAPHSTTDTGVTIVTSPHTTPLLPSAIPRPATTAGRTGIVTAGTKGTDTGAPVPTAGPSSRLTIPPAPLASGVDTSGRSGAAPTEPAAPTGTSEGTSTSSGGSPATDTLLTHSTDTTAGARAAGTTGTSTGSTPDVGIQEAAGAHLETSTVTAHVTSLTADAITALLGTTGTAAADTTGGASSQLFTPTAALSPGPVDSPVPGTGLDTRSTADDVAAHSHGFRPTTGPAAATDPAAPARLADAPATLAPTMPATLDSAGPEFMESGRPVSRTTPAMQASGVAVAGSVPEPASAGGRVPDTAAEDTAAEDTVSADTGSAGRVAEAARVPVFVKPSVDPVGGGVWEGRREGAPVTVVRTEIFDPATRQDSARPGLLSGHATYVRADVRRIETPDGRWIR
ncbi:hypothetical protein ACIP10_37215, partial [Streptomyces galbus]